MWPRISKTTVQLEGSGRSATDEAATAEAASTWNETISPPSSISPDMISRIAGGAGGSLASTRSHFASLPTITPGIRAFTITLKNTTLKIRCAPGAFDMIGKIARMIGTAPRSPTRAM